MSSYIKRFAKYGMVGHGVGMWDKVNNTFSIGKPEYPNTYKVYTVVEVLSKSFTYYEKETDGSYAGGDFGYIKGKGEKKTAQNKWYFCYDGDNLIGFISEYNVMFTSQDRFHIIYIDGINSKFNLQP